MINCLINGKNILKYIMLAALTLTVLSGCREVEEEHTLYFEKSVVEVGPQSGTVSVIIRSNTQWTIDTQDEWFDYNIRKGASSASVIFSFTENETGGVREKTISATATDGGLTTSFILRQLPSEYALSLGKTSISVESDQATHDIDLNTTIDYEDIEVTVMYADEEITGWITDMVMANGKLSVTLSENNGDAKRIASISLYHCDDYGRESEASVLITQMYVMNEGNAEQKDMDYANAIAVGEISENIYVSGIIVAAGKGTDHNYKSDRYIIQDNAGRSLVFESDGELSLELNDGLDLWLLGADMETRTEAGFTFNTATRIADRNVLRKQPGQIIVPVQIGMSELTDAHLNTLVTLKDVEVAIPEGTWSNYNAYYVSGAGSDMVLVRFHPTGIRDAQGSFMYANINTEWKYAYTSTGGTFAELPKGSGNLTGIIVRETNSNMGDIGSYQIRPRWADPDNVNDIGIDASTNNISGILVEWDCTAPAGYEGMSNIPASGGEQMSTAKLFKSNATKLTTSNGQGNIYFIADYRDGKTINSGTANAQVWGTDVWWIMQVSTAGVSGELSLQIETNVNPEHGPKNFVTEYSLDGSIWSAVPGGSYVLQGQTTSAYKTTVNYSPGFKCYNFRLPAAVNNQSAVYIRLRPANKESVHATYGDFINSSTNRLAHVSIKYNK